MNDLHIYGYVFYNSMRYIKGKCPNKASNKFRKELTAYVNLWTFCLDLLYDEITSGNNNTGKLKEYIHLNRTFFSDPYVEGVLRESPAELSREIPIKAISMICEYVSVINIKMINYNENYKDINKYLIALHNLPRCLLKPSDRMYASEDEAIGYSQL